MTQVEKDRKRFPRNLAGGILIGVIIGLILGLIDGDLLEGLGFGFVIGLAIGAAFDRRDQMMQYPPGMLRRIVLAGGFFILSLIASLELMDLAQNNVLQVLLAILPVVAFAFVVFAIGSALASLDELQRRIQTEAIAIGFGMTAFTVVGVGLLAEVGLKQPDWIYVVFPMTLGWGVGKLWTMWKYR